MNTPYALSGNGRVAFSSSPSLAVARGVTYDCPRIAKAGAALALGPHVSVARTHVLPTVGHSASPCVCAMLSVISVMVCPRNVVPSLSCQDFLYIAPPALSPSEAEADTAAVGVVAESPDVSGNPARYPKHAGAAARRQQLGEHAALKCDLSYVMLYDACDQRS